MKKFMVLAALVAGLVLIFPRQSGATTLVVDADGHGSATDCKANDMAFTTIQQAVASLPDEPNPDAPRRVILVCPGTYATGDDGAGARVGIGKNTITIVSTDGPKVTKISGVFSYGFLINAHNVTIQGFTIEEGEKRSITPGTVGVFIRGDGIHVLNNIVTDTDFGICVSELVPPGLPQSDVSNIVQDNLVHDNNQGIFVGLGCPAETGRSALRSFIANNIVDSNQTGITIAPGATAIFVEGNAVHRNTLVGISTAGTNTKCHGNNVSQHRGLDFSGPEAACAPEDNTLMWVGQGR
jgi:hypothetical protein